ncbi:unnamed protein product [Hyaloperonospora brassicae]|uniref:RxLR effector candidate protein n=1 Tax=Hyaloperonospora brassicae TaxID=162125 RepID=A0AAV0TNL7_HYABA|nr:unnamed protein product [Hyaloperonospora brassicae]
MAAARDKKQNGKFSAPHESAVRAERPLLLHANETSHRHETRPNDDDDNAAVPPQLGEAVRYEEQQQKPPSVHGVPKSALFSRLEAFLPVMAAENKKLSEKVAAGEGAKHNIEVEEADERSDGDADDVVASDDEAKKESKAPVIEMNFALGMMDDNGSDGDDTAAVDSEALTAAAIRTGRATDMTSDSTAPEAKTSSFRMRHEKPSAKPRPVIQELT